jgi:hypothetical protein
MTAQAATNPSQTWICHIGLASGRFLLSAGPLGNYDAGEPEWIGNPILRQTALKIRHTRMNTMIEAQELARVFNEDEAVWRCYERKRLLRRPALGLPFSEHISDYSDFLDHLAWLAAEREGRMVRAIGFFLP